MAFLMFLKMKNKTKFKLLNFLSEITIFLTLFLFSEFGTIIFLGSILLLSTPYWYIAIIYVILVILTLFLNKFENNRYVRVAVNSANPRIKTKFYILKCKYTGLKKKSKIIMGR